MEPIDSPIARRLAELLKTKGLTAREVAVQSGLSPDAVRNIIVGRSGNPKQDTLAAIAKVLGVTPASLIDVESPVVASAPGVAAHRRLRPTPVPADQLFSDNELALLAVLGVQIVDGPEVWVLDPGTGERRQLVPPFWTREGVKGLAWSHVSAAYEALKREMAPEDGVVRER